MTDITKNELRNIDVIIELEQLFENIPNVHQKLKIIEFFISSLDEQAFINKYTEYISTCDKNYVHLKPSRILNIINAFVNGKENSGYIQPIGKQLFLNEFLKKYPSPRFLHFGEEEWTTDFLAEYIKRKYACIITPDTIRKELTNLKKKYKDQNNSAEIEYKEYLLETIQNYNETKYIYFYQLYFTPYPFKETEAITHNNRKSGFVGCIYGKSPNNDNPSYKRKPYFQLSANYKTHIPNLSYYLDIPVISGLILLDDTYDSRKIVRDYYFWCFTHENHLPKYQLYFIPNDIYSNSEILTEFENATFLFRTPLINYGKIAFEEFEYDDPYEAFFDYSIRKEKKTNGESFYKKPKLLKKK